MRLWVFSDIHIESCIWDLPADCPEHDIIVAAGDILTPCSDAVHWLAERAGGRPVVHVPGNHEWYAHPRPFTVAQESARARAAAREEGVAFLMDETAIIGGVRFLGATLWTDYDLYGTAARSMAIAGASINDHRLIFPDDETTPLSPARARLWHKASRAWLEAALAQPFSGPTVVVTHHLPHPRSVAAQFANDALNPAFCSDLSALVEGSGAALWIHGHTHCSFDYLAGDVRVVCNPKGYGPRIPGAGSENPRFDPRFVVHV